MKEAMEEVMRLKAADDAAVKACIAKRRVVRVSGRVQVVAAM